LVAPQVPQMATPQVPRQRSWPHRRCRGDAEASTSLDMLPIFASGVSALSLYISGTSWRLKA